MKVKSYLDSLSFTGLAPSAILSSPELTEARASGPACLSSQLAVGTPGLTAPVLSAMARAPF